MLHSAFQCPLWTSRTLMWPLDALDSLPFSGIDSQYWLSLASNRMWTKEKFHKKEEKEKSKIIKITRNILLKEGCLSESLINRKDSKIYFSITALGEEVQWFCHRFPFGLRSCRKINKESLSTNIVATCPMSVFIKC